MARIVSNYGRLFCTLVAGLLLVPLQLAWLGNDGFALLALLGATVGIASILQDMMRHSMTRELGAAWHEDADRFTRSYSAAFVVCLVVALLTVLAFAVLVAVLPVLRIPPGLVRAGRYLVAAEGAWTAVLILVSPIFNMYVVTERFVAHNTWTAMQRASYLVAAAVLYFVVGLRDVEVAIIWFSITASGLSILLFLTASVIMLASEPRTRRFERRMGREAIREVAGTFGWNGAVVLAMNLHERVGQIVMNVVFGLWGNVIFGLALRLVSYVRMMTLGMTFGLDAVSARLTSATDDGALRAVLRHSTRLHGTVAIPGSLVVLLLVEPLLRLWVGRIVQDPDPETGRAVLASAGVLVRIMVVGLAARAIADGWMKLLYGAGHIRRYAPAVLLGGAANPVIAVLLIWLLPPSIDYSGAAWALAILMVLVHLVVLPMIGARALGCGFADLVGPLARPALLAVLPAPLLALPILLAWRPGWSGLLGLLGAYGGLYALLTVAFGLSGDERRRFVRLVRRRPATG